MSMHLTAVKAPLPNTSTSAAADSIKENLKELAICFVNE